MPRPLCGSQGTVENSERDGNTRPPGLPPEKPACRSGSKTGGLILPSLSEFSTVCCDPHKGLGIVNKERIHGRTI